MLFAIMRQFIHKATTTFLSTWGDSLGFVDHDDNKENDDDGIRYEQQFTREERSVKKQLSKKSKQISKKQQTKIVRKTTPNSVKRKRPHEVLNDDTRVKNNSVAAIVNVVVHKPKPLGFSMVDFSMIEADETVFENLIDSEKIKLLKKSFTRTQGQKGSECNFRKKNSLLTDISNQTNDRVSNKNQISRSMTTNPLKRKKSLNHMEPFNSQVNDVRKGSKAILVRKDVSKPKNLSLNPVKGMKKKSTYDSNSKLQNTKKYNANKKQAYQLQNYIESNRSITSASSISVPVCNHLIATADKAAIFNIRDSQTISRNTETVIINTKEKQNTLFHVGDKYNGVMDSLGAFQIMKENIPDSSKEGLHPLAIDFTEHLIPELEESITNETSYIKPILDEQISKSNLDSIEKLNPRRRSGRVEAIKRKKELYDDSSRIENIMTNSYGSSKKEKARSVTKTKRNVSKQQRKPRSCEKKVVSVRKCRKHPRNKYQSSNIYVICDKKKTKLRSPEPFCDDSSAMIDIKVRTPTCQRSSKGSKKRSTSFSNVATNRAEVRSVYDDDLCCSPDGSLATMFPCSIRLVSNRTTSPLTVGTKRRKRSKSLNTMSTSQKQMISSELKSIILCRPLSTPNHSLLCHEKGEHSQMESPDARSVGMKSNCSIYDKEQMDLRSKAVDLREPPKTCLISSELKSIVLGRSCNSSSLTKQKFQSERNTKNQDKHMSSFYDHEKKLRESEQFSVHCLGSKDDIDQEDQKLMSAILLSKQLPVSPLTMDFPRKVIKDFNLDLPVPTKILYSNEKKETQSMDLSGTPCKKTTEVNVTEKVVTVTDETKPDNKNSGKQQSTNPNNGFSITSTNKTLPFSLQPFYDKKEITKACEQNLSDPLAVSSLVDIVYSKCMEKCMQVFKQIHSSPGKNTQTNSGESLGQEKSKSYVSSEMNVATLSHKPIPTSKLIISSPYHFVRKERISVVNACVSECYDGSVSDQNSLDESSDESMSEPQQPIIRTEGSLGGKGAVDSQRENILTEALSNLPSTPPLSPEALHPVQPLLDLINIDNPGRERTCSTHQEECYFTALLLEDLHSPELTSRQYSSEEKSEWDQKLEDKNVTTLSGSFKQLQDAGYSCVNEYNNSLIQNPSPTTMSPQIPSARLQEESQVFSNEQEKASAIQEDVTLLQASTNGMESFPLKKASKKRKDAARQVAKRKRGSNQEAPAEVTCYERSQRTRLKTNRYGYQETLEVACTKRQSTECLEINLLPADESEIIGLDKRCPTTSITMVTRPGLLHGCDNGSRLGWTQETSPVLHDIVCVNIPDYILNQSVALTSSHLPAKIDEKVLDTGNQSGDGKEWSSSQVENLKKARAQVNPISTSFWSDVAVLVGGKSALECRERWYSLVKTPIQRYKKKRSKKEIKSLHEEDDLFNSTPFRDESAEATSVHFCFDDISPIYVHKDTKSNLLLMNRRESSSSTTLVDDDAFNTYLVHDESPMVALKGYIKGMKRDISRTNKDKKKKRGGVAEKKKVKPLVAVMASYKVGDIDLKARLSPSGNIALRDQTERDDVDDFWNEMYKDSDDE